MSYQKLSLVVGLSLTLLLTSFFAVSADDAAPGAETASTVLKGGVVEVNVTLNDLRDARLSISRVRKATANLYDEVTRQQVTMTSNPNVVGTTVINIPRPVFSGPPLPARKKWVDASMQEIGPVIKLFKEDVDKAIESDRRVDISEAGRKKLDPLRQDAFAQVKASFEIYQQLEKLTSGSSFDNEAIATDSKHLDQHMKDLDRSFKKGISILQREAKSKNSRA